jgi:hypothetical protein
MRLWIGVVLAASTFSCAYKPGSFAYARNTFPGQRATVGCLDVAVERRDDMQVGPALGFQFANRCDHLAKVDLAGVRVIGRGARGRETPLVPFDPNHELKLAWLDGRSANAEALAFSLDANGLPTPRMVEVCVDFASIAGQAPAQWRCFASQGPVTPLPPPVAAADGGAP